MTLAGVFITCGAIENIAISTNFGILFFENEGFWEI